MCSGGELLADFSAGTRDRPEVPLPVQRCLTMTTDGAWVVWAEKLARALAADLFVPLTGGPAYPADALAECRVTQGHDAPQPGCTCGFHALAGSGPYLERKLQANPGFVRLDVALSGRVLAFEWLDGRGVLFRAARQTVLRVPDPGPAQRRRPEEPGGRLAYVSEADPKGAGPVSLRLPQSPPAVAVLDDAGYCILDRRPIGQRREAMLAIA